MRSESCAQTTISSKYCRYSPSNPAAVLPASYSFYNPQIRDTGAAGCFVAAEAGATVTDLDTDYKWGLQTRAWLIASSQAVHDELHNLVDESKIGRLG
jgi:hypothetical protein